MTYKYHSATAGLNGMAGLYLDLNTSLHLSFHFSKFPIIFLTEFRDVGGAICGHNILSRCRVKKKIRTAARIKTKSPDELNIMTLMGHQSSFSLTGRLGRFRFFIDRSVCSVNLAITWRVK